MCDPVTGSITIASAMAAASAAAPTILAVTAAGSAVAGVVAQKQSGDAQDAANSRQYDSAVTSRNQNANQIELERQQQTDAAGQKIMANNTAMREAQGTVAASAGPSGLSVEALLGNLAQKGANYNDSVNQNLDRTNAALDNQLQNVNSNAASQINQLKTPASPDYLGAALKIGQAYQTNFRK